MVSGRSTLLPFSSRALAQRQASGQLVASAELAEVVRANRLTTWFSERLHRLYDMTNVE